MKQILIDTNVLIGWYKIGTLSVSDDLDNLAPVFSIITKIEALGFLGITASEARAITAILDSGDVIYINEDIAGLTIRLRQNHKIKTPDAIIAATALANKTELWTANISDFSRIAGLRLFNPFA